MPAGKSTQTDQLLQPVRHLWESTIAPYLEAPLWSNRDAYDAGQVLMVPLHAAIALDEPDWIQGFRRHFEQLDAHLQGGGGMPSSRLTRFQYLYLATRADALAADGHSPVPARLRLEVVRELRREWRDIRGRILRKLAYGPRRPTTKAAISDGLLFPLALAADLGSSGAEDAGDLAEEAIDLAATILDAAGVKGEDGGWLFQPEALRDHPDHAFAGQSKKRPGMSPKPGPGAWDSSHAARFPLWLRSLGQAADKAEGRAFRHALAGLRRQFLNSVVEAPDTDFPLPRLRNFMDGSNGVYRWGYETLGPERGYGPYELSGALTLGWWGFLGGKRVARLHAQIATSFPLSDQIVELYAGPKTRRKRNPLVREPDSYRNGLRELLTRLAAVLALEDPR